MCKDYLLCFLSNRYHHKENMQDMFLIKLTGTQYSDVEIMDYGKSRTKSTTMKLIYISNI